MDPSGMSMYVQLTVCPDLLSDDACMHVLKLISHFYLLHSYLRSSLERTSEYRVIIRSQGLEILCKRIIHKSKIEFCLDEDLYNIRNGVNVYVRVVLKPTWRA